MMNQKKWLIPSLLLVTMLSPIVPAIAQFRLDRPSFFQDGQQLMDQEIQRLQQQSQQQSPNSQQPASGLLTINTDSFQWEKYIFRIGGFSVWMPSGTQSEEQVMLKTSIGDLKFITFATHPQSYRFVAAYSDILETTLLKNSTEVLASVRDGIVAKTQFKLISDEDITFEQSPAKQILVSNNGELIAFRIYIANQRIYVLAADHKKANSLSQAAINFFESFRLLN